MKNLNYECKRQLRYYNEFLSEGRELIEDPANLADKIGTVQELEVFLQMDTPSKKLCKLYVKGTEHLEKAFFLVPRYQIVRDMNISPVVGEYFTLRCVVGARRVGESHWIPALRLPQ